jgi:hypothetical protein
LKWKDKSRDPSAQRLPASGLHFSSGISKIGIMRDTLRSRVVEDSSHAERSIFMRRVMLFTVLTSVGLLLVSAVGQSQDQRRGGAGKAQDQKATREFTSNQLLMRDKLVQMNLVLEGLTLDKFDQVEVAGERMWMISKATGWHISDQTPRYQLLAKNFQETAGDLQRHAKEKNVEAATLDLVRLNIMCAQCHQHMRELAARPR